ncbi:hypothetical protein [Streptomyces sp. NPDC048445]|uniref:hypothetical protein n=1 Tax=Streptomyces sp. NPDC048445 TaxID=3365553 RepID=UPI003713B8B2
MARSAAKLHADLTAASHKLREVGSADLAEAVDEALTSRGLGALRNAVEAGNKDPNLSISLSVTDRDRIKSAAAAAKASLQKDVADGFAAFIAGTFIPEQPARAAYGAATAKVNLNVRAQPELTAAVKQAAEDQADELGWTPKPMHIAAAWLLKKYPAPKPSKAVKK